MGEIMDVSTKRKRGWTGRRIDPRGKLILLIVACFICQYAPVGVLPVWLVFLGCLFIPMKRRGRMFRLMMRGGVGFILFWMMMTVGSDVFGGKGWGESVVGALPLGGRLFGLTLTGIFYVGWASPVETGRAAAWFLRPVLGEWAWRPALGVALTAWFLPQALRLAGEVRGGMRARGVRVSLWRRVELFMGTGLRILEGKAEELAVGLASRRLDDGRSWR